MKLFERVWTVITQILNVVTISPFGDNGLSQIPLLGERPPVVEQPLVEQAGGPIFKPPGGLPTGDGSDFQCDYSSMTGWRDCSTAEDRSCWLTDDKGGIFDINTNYEDNAPKGILRQYTLTITNGSFNADGLPFPESKLFDDKYPGPWIQACWGDTVEITVHNNLPHNGTSIHWHGIRQLGSMAMDGVNGVTQCPIAPNDTYVYRFNITQYGSTWYHSHYSLQYSDGLVGPMTLHGPSSAPFDEAAKTPLLMTDWGECSLLVWRNSPREGGEEELTIKQGHNSAFDAAYTGLQTPSILLNGRGNVTQYNNGTKATLPIPQPYTITFEKPAQPRSKRYLLRLINTSSDTTFVFSIDNHNITIIGSDFVPIHPYSNTSVLIGIGQRYHVIVEANPIANGSQPIPDDGNFWMRTYVATCPRLIGTNFTQGYEQTGILRYDNTSTAVPTSKPWNDVSLACSDETYSSLVPILKWQVGSPSNGNMGQEHDVRFSAATKPYPLALFSLELPSSSTFNPLRINYSDPTFLHLNNLGGEWPTQWVVVPEDFKSADWVYMVLAGDRTRGNLTTGAHPIHLHGHDFAILQQTESLSFDITHLNLKLDNPPRRDVVLLPANGFVVIAFKTDNPGSWLLHCHIARHASAGLAMQILERRADADALFPGSSPAVQPVIEGCNKWNNWFGDCHNWWPGGEDGCNRGSGDVFAFQDDSGI